MPLEKGNILTMPVPVCMGWRLVWLLDGLVVYSCFAHTLHAHHLPTFTPLYYYPHLPPPTHADSAAHMVGWLVDRTVPPPHTPHTFPHPHPNPSPFPSSPTLPLWEFSAGHAIHLLYWTYTISTPFTYHHHTFPLHNIRHYVHTYTSGLVVVVWLVRCLFTTTYPYSHLWRWGMGRRGGFGLVLCGAALWRFGLRNAGLFMAAWFS